MMKVTSVITKKEHEEIRNQSGVTLLLSTLILSAISAVAFSVASITLIEVRTSQDVLRTDISYYNVQGVAEDGIFIFKRQVNASKADFGTLNSGDTCSSFSSLVEGPMYPSVTTRTRRCLFNAEHIIRERIPASSNTFETAKRFYIYDPSKLTPGDQNAGFSKLVISNTSDASLNLYICRLDTLCDETVSGFMFGTPTTLLGSVTKTYNLSPDVVDKSRDSYEIIIKYNGGTGDGEVELQTFGPNDAIPKGLPYLNKEGLEIESTRGNLTRRVQVLVPTQ